MQYSIFAWCVRFTVRNPYCSRAQHVITENRRFLLKSSLVNYLLPGIFELRGVSHCVPLVLLILRPWLWTKLPGLLKSFRLGNFRYPTITLKIGNCFSLPNFLQFQFLYYAEDVSSIRVPNDMKSKMKKSYHLFGFFSLLNSGLGISIFTQDVPNCYDFPRGSNR